jgi:hypothetical protein
MQKTSSYSNSLVAPNPFQKENTLSGPSNRSGMISKNAFNSIPHAQASLYQPGPSSLISENRIQISKPTFITLSKRIDENEIVPRTTITLPYQFPQLLSSAPVLPSTFQYRDVEVVVEGCGLNVREDRWVGFNYGVPGWVEFVL